MISGELKSSTPVPFHTEDSIASDSDILSGSDVNLNVSTVRWGFVLLNFLKI